MKRVEAILTAFEQALDPQHLEQSPVKAELVGYGEISAIFAIDAIDGWVFKRMPLFTSREQAEAYLANYYEYCELLTEAGLNLPGHDCFIIPNGRLFVLYIGQERFAAEALCHRRIHAQGTEETLEMLDRIIQALNGIQAFNRRRMPEREIAIDGQLSNWAWQESEGAHRLAYFDTSTPLFKRSGVEAMDPELVLKSAPGPLRAAIRMFFLDDVMNRYYRPREVYIDLVANLYKEQCPGLIPAFLERINRHLPENEAITSKEVGRYYREDKFIWQFFLAARRIDRWVKRTLLGRPYEFILPGPIRR